VSPLPQLLQRRRDQALNAGAGAQAFGAAEWRTLGVRPWGGGQGHSLREGCGLWGRIATASRVWVEGHGGLMVR